MEVDGITGSGTANDDETVVNSKSGFATDVSIGDVVCVNTSYQTIPSFKYFLLFSVYSIHSRH